MRWADDGGDAPVVPTQKVGCVQLVLPETLGLLNAVEDYLRAEAIYQFSKHGVVIEETLHCEFRYPNPANPADYIENEAEERVLSPYVSVLYTAEVVPHGGS
jgi:hypothetical protein